MKKLLPLLLTVALILPPLSPSLPGPTEVTASSPPSPYVTLLDKGITLLAEANYRTQVSLLGPYDLTRLHGLGVTILRAEGDAALVLASEEQLAQLAQLQFHPRDTNRLDVLVTADHRRPTAAALTSADLVSLSSVDSDGDGLTDTEGGWWCTDSLNPDSDGDLANDRPNRCAFLTLKPGDKCSIIQPDSTLAYRGEG